VFELAVVNQHMRIRIRCYRRQSLAEAGSDRSCELAIPFRDKHLSGRVVRHDFRSAIASAPRIG
jgi:hypothetical protein